MSSEPSAMSPQPWALSPQQPASQPWAPVGPNVPQVLQGSTLELKVRHSSCDQILIYFDRWIRMPFVRRSAKVAPKRVLSAKVRFGVPKQLI